MAKTTKKAQIGDVIILNNTRHVVESAVMDGGGTGHGPYDVFPDGWHISARQLHKNGKYNPKGKLTTFYQSGCFTGMIPEVEVVGQMKRVVNFVSTTKPRKKKNKYPNGKPINWNAVPRGSYD